MELITSTNNVLKCLSLAEKKAVLQVYNAMENKDCGHFKIKDLPSKSSSVITAIGKLTIVGIINTQNLGAKGVRFEVNDRQALLEIASKLSLVLT